MQMGTTRAAASPLSPDHASEGAAGNSTRNVDPLPTSLSTVSVPPWAVAMGWQMESPSPVPLPWRWGAVTGGSEPARAPGPTRGQLSLGL
jgi:hypothetical protein